VTAEGFTVSIPAGTFFRMADGSVWTGRDDTLDRYRHGAWRQVMELPTPGLHWYVNVIRPVNVSGDVVTWRDLIVDVEAYPDGAYHIADIPEMVNARATLPAANVERVRQEVVAIVDDVKAARPPFHQTDSETPYGSEESRFWLIPGAGDGLAVIGDIGGAGRASVERMVARLNPVSVHDASVNPLMALPPDAPPRDGVLIAGAPRDLVRLVPHARAALGIYGGRVPVTLALALDRETDPLAELHAALDESERTLTMRLDGELRRSGIPSRGIVTAARFVAASWF
jgi:protein associated with RNAse G/E